MTHNEKEKLASLQKAGKFDPNKKIDNPIWDDLRKGNLNANFQEEFFSILIKGLIYNLNRNIKIRGNYVPHFILNTGDDSMYLEVKGQNMSVEPQDVSNEAFVYSMVPRCMVVPGGLNIESDQLTSPYSRGQFDFEFEDNVYRFIAEFRRMPLTFTVDLTYLTDNYIDALNITQQMLTNLTFINDFDIVYLGQTIDCSYKMPDAHDREVQMEFDGDTTESKLRKMSVQLEVSTNLPIIYNQTIMPADAYFKDMHGWIFAENKGTL